MNHITKFESYVSIHEAEATVTASMEMEKADKFDPEAAKKAQTEYAKKTGGGTSDKSTSGLDFPNIKAVFKRQDYNFRVAIAEALFLCGYNEFPSNSYHSPGAQERDLKNLGCTMTYYIGEADQNEILKGISVKALEAIKGLVALVYLDFSKYTGGDFMLVGGRYQYTSTLNQIKKFPEVVKYSSLLKKV